MTHPEAFCESCEVHVDLHPYWDGEPTEADCSAALARAELMDRFFGAGL